MKINPHTALKLPCYFCGGPLRRDNAWFEIHDQELPPFRCSDYIKFNQHGGKELYGELAYPGNGDWAVQSKRWHDFVRVVLFAHTECGPDVGYNFSFDRLAENWDRHLKGKVWWCFEIPEALKIARSAMGITKISSRY